MSRLKFDDLLSFKVAYTEAAKHTKETYTPHSTFYRKQILSASLKGRNNSCNKVLITQIKTSRRADIFFFFWRQHGGDLADNTQYIRSKVAYGL